MNETFYRVPRIFILATIALVAVAGILISSPAWAFTVNVVNPSGSPVSGFRWLVEEDAGLPVTPGVPSATSQTVNLNRSYAPVVKTGTSTGSSANIALPSDRIYLVSILPNSGYTLGAHQVKIGQASVTVVVNPHPVETAQLAVHVFEDNDPVNGAPDIPAEASLEGFQVFVYDYAGMVSQDVFGNPLGTTYNADGSVAQMGGGILLTDANGDVIVKNLAPGKYGAQAIPPRGENWIQTSTIEGTKGIDSWLRSGEPPYFVEFGIASWHVFIGFLHPMTLPTGGGGPVGTISGRAVYIRDSRPPATQVSSGLPVPNAWVALNNLSGNDEQVYAQPCAADGSFTIGNVPPGTYQLVTFDTYLDVIIDFRTVIVPSTGGSINLGDVAVNAWFGTLSGSVFNDLNENGFRDNGEAGVPDQVINLRFPDATVYQSTKTNPNGDYAIKEVFPWFAWTIQEVDFTRYAATGATVIVDDGGSLAPGAVNHPQPQPENGGLGYRTETGPSLLEAFLLYAGQQNIVNWGKKAYSGTDNGGITGIVAYSTTRAEDDPRMGTMETWEPGIPRIQVNLYEDADGNKVIDDVNGDAAVTLADIDNWPFDNFPGAEDVDHNGNSQFDPGDALQIVWTDSWDDNLPTGCAGDPQTVHGQPIVDCAQTLRTWNQVRPGVFDGGFAFWSYFPGGMESGSAETSPLAPGRYIVEAVTPAGYELVKEEDKNVDFGDPYQPIVASLPAECVGAPHLVPETLSLFPDEQIVPYYHGQVRPLCDKKEVFVTPGNNAAANFFFFTEVPVSGRAWGIMLNDITTDFNLNSPQYGDKLGPAWIPISFRDFSGHEFARVYTDEWGRYNTLVPSTYSANIPTPTGVSPGVSQICLNNPGPIEDPSGSGDLIIDPWYDPRYGQTCQNMEYFPGKTTISDTPILPIAAFTGSDKRLDCEFGDGTPVIAKVDSQNGGPALTFSLGFFSPASARTITITSRGSVQVPNPNYDPSVPGSPTTITRDYGFGPSAGQVLLNGNPITINSWAANGKTISATVPTSATTGELEVIRSNGRRTTVGITLNINESPIVRVAAGQSIQTAIDNAASGSLILVAPGHYPEHLIMYKKLRLQGYGAYSTFLDALPLMPGQDTAWDAKVQSLIDSGKIQLIDGERPTFFLERGSGILVATKNGEFNRTKSARIDGFTITAAITGGGIFVNAYAHFLEIGNNVIVSNQGTIGGGIRVGTPSLINANSSGYLSSFNDNLFIHNNAISMNGSVDNGGGIALNNGSDNYRVNDNFICGNYTLQYGAGIVHHGLSSGGIIQRNRILFNESTDEGAGIMLTGELMPPESPFLTPGVGTTTINSNLIQGNMAGDDGAGIRVLMANGQDVANNRNNPLRWHSLLIANNMIVNNVSADVGGGISLDDAALIAIYNNTIADNDSSGTGVDAFGNCTVGNPIGQTCPPGAGGVNNSVPRAAGIGANAHSAGLQAAFGNAYRQTYSKPIMANNIIWHNRSFWWDATANGGTGALQPAPASPIYWDLAVYGLGSPVRLNPTYGVLTDVTGYSPTNTASNPNLSSAYFNVLKATAGGLGNLVYVVFSPITQTGNYHILSGSSAISRGTANPLATLAVLRTDYDRQTRPNGSVDAGADEYYTGTTPPMALAAMLDGTAAESFNALYNQDDELLYADEDSPDLIDDDEEQTDSPLSDDELLAAFADNVSPDASDSSAADTAGDEDGAGGCGA